MFLTVLPARWIPSWMAASKLSGDSALISMILATDMAFSFHVDGGPAGRLYPTQQSAGCAPDGAQAVFSRSASGGRLSGPEGAAGRVPSDWSRMRSWAGSPRFVRGGA